MLKKEEWIQSSDESNYKYFDYNIYLPDNTRLLYDTVYVIGGYIAQYLIESDIEILYDEVEKYSPFPEYRDYIQISKMPVHNITIGAALPYINEFLDNPAPDA